MANINIPITENGTTTLATAGKYCDRNVDVVVNVAGGGGGDIPEEAFNITGDCSYLNYNGRWDWFFNEYGNQITITPNRIPSWMYQSKLRDFKPNLHLGTGCNAAFIELSSLETVSGIITSQKGCTANLFSGCRMLSKIPPNTYPIFFASTSDDMMGMIFQTCYSLRKIPQEIMPYLNGKVNSSMFAACAALDCIDNFPIHGYYQYSSFYNTFSNTCRLSRFTFVTDNGIPLVAEWNKDTIDLSTSGFATSSYVGVLTSYNSGLTTATQVTDDASYQALKDNPDWWTADVNYSRYNHDSAVETINSLPDTSEYLATNGGTNTIKFKGAAGSLTDGGAINTLTAEEIAVATAKGWTVTLV